MAYLVQVKAESRHANHFSEIAWCVLVLLVLGNGPAAMGASPPLAAYQMNQVASSQEAKKQLSQYEKALPRAGNNRGPMLAQMARLYFILGDFAGNPSGREYYEKGKDWAQLLEKEQPRRVEGHYWLALNLGGLASLAPAKEALKTLPAIIQELEKAEAIDGGYAQGGPHRVLGRIYARAPAWPFSVGDLQKSEEHLRKAVKISPDNSTNHLYLAQTLFEMGKTEEARKELEKTLHSKRHATGPQGLKEDREKARRLLKEYE
jgi:tetratricopeptide (TPR) repeat protein